MLVTRFSRWYHMRLNIHTIYQKYCLLYFSSLQIKSSQYHSIRTKIWGGQNKEFCLYNKWENKLKQIFFLEITLFSGRGRSAFIHLFNRKILIGTLQCDKDSVGIKYTASSEKFTTYITRCIQFCSIFIGIYWSNSWYRLWTFLQINFITVWMGQALSSSKENGTSEYILMRELEPFECFYHSVSCRKYKDKWQRNPL